MELDQTQKRQAELLHAWRTYRGMSLQGVADAIHRTVTKQAVSLWELGRRRIPKDVIAELPGVFGVSESTYSRGPRS